MKLIIDIPDDLYTKLSKSTEDWACCYVEGWQKTIAQTIRNGIPYEEKPQGEWIDVNKDGSLWKCSVCKEQSCCRGAYCPDCGSKMRNANL